MQFFEIRVTKTTSDVLREAGIHRTNAKSQTTVLFYHKEEYFNKQRPKHVTKV